MDDCDIEPTPNDPEFDPYECESTYALWTFKEEGEPVKFLEASLVENPDCPSGYSFCWRTLSLCDRTGKLVDRFGGDIGDVSRADYIADTVLPGGAVSSQVEDDSLPNLPYSFEEGDLDDTARKSAAEAIRGAILSLPLSIAESTEAVPAFYRIDNPAMPDDPSPATCSPTRSNPWRTPIAAPRWTPCCATGTEWMSRSRPSSPPRRGGCSPAASCSI